MKADPYQRIADALLASVDSAGEWVPCWHRSGLRMPVNAVSGKQYEGVNVLSCWAARQTHAFDSHRWATYTQWQSVGAQVSRGSKGTPIVFWSKTEPENEESEGRWFAKAYTVFNRDQVINPPPAPEDDYSRLGEEARIDTVEVFVEKLKTEVVITERESTVPHYDPAEDVIVMPVFARFHDGPAYYSTLFHEATHWTGHRDREARDFSGRYGDDSYALEELVAELGAVFLAADLGLETEPRPDHAAYIGHWFRILKERPEAFAHAVSQARKATTRIHAIAECST